MSFPPVFHEVADTLRFGRVLFVELAPGPPSNTRGRYSDVLARRGPLPSRGHFSAPERALGEILGMVDRGVSVEAVVLGGAGDPLRHRGIGTILRRIRTSAHLETVVLTDGRMLADREVRRDAGEAGQVVAWLPALVDPVEETSGIARRDAWERHVEGIASLRRETPTRVALEMPVRPGQNDVPETLDAWSRSVERIRPHRVFVISSPEAATDEPAVALERVKAAVHPEAGAFLDDGTIVEQRVFPGE